MLIFNSDLYLRVFQDHPLSCSSKHHATKSKRDVEVKSHWVYILWSQCHLTVFICKYKISPFQLLHRDGIFFYTLMELCICRTKF